MKIQNKQLLCGVYPFQTSSKDTFTKACKSHDLAYIEGSIEQKIFSRKEVDQIFLKQMLELSGESKLKKIKAYTYYALVRLFGGMFWEGSVSAKAGLLRSKRAE